MDTRQILTAYMEKVINSKDKNEWRQFFLFIDGKIHESEGELKEVFMQMRDKMKDYFNKNIKNDTRN